MRRVARGDSRWWYVDGCDRRCIVGIRGVKIRNYRAFGAEPQGFDEFKSINIVIGRNNSGKSALLDVVGFLSSSDFRPDILSSRGAEVPALRMRAVLDEADLRQQFAETVSGGPIRGNHWAFAQRYLDTEVVFDVAASSGTISIVDSDVDIPTGVEPMMEATVGQLPRPFHGRTVRSVDSERDVVPEAGDHDPSIRPDGSGATTAIRHFITKSNLDRSIVQQDMLRDLNAIFAPDAEFAEITVQQHDDGMWEVFLVEPSKGLVSLSKSGSGLKTVLQVLSNIHLSPALDGVGVDESVFVLEELENSLHPALQRRLFAFLRESAVTRDFTIFVSTHSSVVIDLFHADAQAQMLHVVHDGSDARVTPVASYIHRADVLDDLDVRASDLLQANGVVWVEGPTDRLYMNRWIELVSNGQLTEGLHYQCVLYGGRLLAHLTASVPGSSDDELFSMLTVNRNLLFIGDSDKTDETQRLNRTKSRVRREVEAVGGIAWYTSGREIENYIHSGAVQGATGLEVNQVSQYEAFDSYLETWDQDEARRYRRSKIQFAERIVRNMQAAHLDVLDLPDQVEAAVSVIRSWNGLQQ